jgi:hypothetical protein
LPSARSVGLADSRSRLRGAVRLFFPSPAFTVIFPRLTLTKKKSSLEASGGTPFTYKLNLGSCLIQCSVVLPASMCFACLTLSRK